MSNQNINCEDITFNEILVPDIWESRLSNEGLFPNLPFALLSMSYSDIVTYLPNYLSQWVNVTEVSDGSGLLNRSF